MDYVDRYKEDYTNYNHIDDYNDAISAAQYCIPDGWVYELWEHKNFEGKVLTLVGDGTLKGISNFKASDIEFDEKTTSSRWVQRY